MSTTSFDQRRSQLIAWASAAALVALLLTRWFSQTSSFPGSESDYGSHVAIINWLVSTPSWPPVYHGILGAHSITALLHLAGPSIPKAMLVIADVSAVLLLVALARTIWPLGQWAVIAGAATVTLFSAPIFSTMQRDGYFGALVSLGLYASGVAALVRAPEQIPLRTLAVALAWFVAGTVTYPDGAMWCFPLLLLASHGSLERRWWVAAAVVCAAVEFVLLRKQFQVATQPGGGLVTWLGVLVAVLPWSGLLLASRVTGSAAQRARAFAIAWMVVAFLVCANSLMLTGHIEYYARKVLYSLIVVAPIMSALISTESWLGRAVALAGVVALSSRLPDTLRESRELAYARLSDPASQFDGADESCVERVQARAQRRSCKHLLVLPGSKQGRQAESWGQRIMRVMAANSYTHEYDPEHVNLPSLANRLGGSFELADLLRGNPRAALARVLVAAKDSNVDCFAVGPELLPPEKAKGACLVFMTKKELSKSAPGAKDVEGYQDTTSCEHIQGWAWLPADPDARLEVEVLSDAGVVALATADVARDDLAAVGIGDGHYGFKIPTPEALKDGQEHEVTVRTAGLKQPLGMAGQRLRCGQ